MARDIREDKSGLGTFLGRECFMADDSSRIQFEGSLEECTVIVIGGDRCPSGLYRIALLRGLIGANGRFQALQVQARFVFLIPSRRIT